MCGAFPSIPEVARFLGPGIFDGQKMMDATPFLFRIDMLNTSRAPMVTAARQRAARFTPQQNAITSVLRPVVATAPPTAARGLQRTRRGAEGAVQRNAASRSAMSFKDLTGGQHDFGPYADRVTTFGAVSPLSVNYFINRKCNYKCAFCFHTQKNTSMLSLEDSLRGLSLLRAAGCDKINYAGGEPFLNPHVLGELCRGAHELGMAVTIISNGSVIQGRWMEKYGRFVDMLGVSCDSFVPATNALIGRGGDANNRHIERLLRVRQMCADHDIQFKLNTVVNKLNWDEDMNDPVAAVDPLRWKVFQVLVLEGENAGGSDLRDARPLRVTDAQFRAFCDRHRDRHTAIMKPESNEDMQNSYLLLDESMCFLNCAGGGKVPSESIIKVGVERALQQAGFDQTTFEKRGGLFDWHRPRGGIFATSAAQHAVA
jgi:radical S-adenosyl methionine domain-containing protein 2